MRYVLLLLVLCLTFFALDSVSKYHIPLSFLSSGNTRGVAVNGSNTGHRPRSHWATASMIPTKGGPSAGTGLPQVAMASGQGTDAKSGDNAGAVSGSPVAQQAGSADAETAIGTASSVAVTAISANSTLSTSNHSNIAASSGAATKAAGEMVAPASNSGSNATEAAASGGVLAGAEVAADVLTVDLESGNSAEISLTPDYLDLDLTALQDVSMVQPAAGPVVLSAEAADFAMKVADSIRNSLMNPRGIQFGGIAGLNWSGADASAPQKVSGSPLTGFTLGLFADIPLAKQISFRPGLLYSYEGFQPDINGERVNIHMAYLNMPLDLVYHTNLLGKRLFLGAGPYAAYGLNGTYTLKGINTDMQFGNNFASGDNARRLDYGANVMGGLLMDRNFILGASFNLGLNNIAPGGSGMSVKTRSFGISIGYVFRNRQNTPTHTY
jgi:hypothetical protein